MSGCTEAVFKFSGTQPEWKELLIKQPRRSYIHHITRNSVSVITAELEEHFRCTGVYCKAHI